MRYDKHIDKTCWHSQKYCLVTCLSPACLVTIAGGDQDVLEDHNLPPLSPLSQCRSISAEKSPSLRERFSGPARHLLEISPGNVDTFNLIVPWDNSFVSCYFTLNIEEEITDALGKLWGGQCASDSNCADLVAYCDKDHGFTGRWWHLIGYNEWIFTLLTPHHCRLWRRVSAGLVDLADSSFDCFVPRRLLHRLYLPPLLLPVQHLLQHHRLSLLLLLNQERIHSGTVTLKYNWENKTIFQTHLHNNNK